MRYLVDTDWLIDAFVGIPAAVSTLERLSSSGLGISIISVGEIYEGAYRSPDPAARLIRYRDFLFPLTVLLLTDPIMQRFAMIRGGLRHQRNLIPDLDLLIAATAVEQDLALVTRNRRHFGRIPGLTLFHAG